MTVERIRYDMARAGWYVFRDDGLRQTLVSGPLSNWQVQQMFLGQPPVHGAPIPLDQLRRAMRAERFLP
jgi:hypothetical protein